MQTRNDNGSGETTFNWLHLSDLHVGMSDQDWLWPTLKHSFYADRRHLAMPSVKLKNSRD